MTELLEEKFFRYLPRFNPHLREWSSGARPPGRFTERALGFTFFENHPSPIEPVDHLRRGIRRLGSKAPLPVYRRPFAPVHWLGNDLTS